MSPFLSLARRRAQSKRLIASHRSTVRPGIERLERRCQPAAGLVQGYGQLPLSFVANEGQTDPGVDYLSRGPGYGLFLTPTAAVLSLAGTESTGAVLRMQVLNGDPNAHAVGMNELPAKVNYILGADRADWHTNISTFGRVAYDEVYPGIDLVYYGNQRSLEFDFLVAAGADPAQIRLCFQGMTQAELDGAGNLLLHTSAGDVVQQAPVLYQEVNGTRRSVTGHYVFLDNGSVGFSVGEYDPLLPLVIDPVLVYSSYLGGAGADQAQAVAVDSSGCAYVTGTTASLNFPIANAPQPLNGGGNDVFVTKLSASGSQFVYSTYLGGQDYDAGMAITVDANGRALVAGNTQSTNFPTKNPPQGSYGGSNDLFATILSPSGSDLVFSTYFGLSKFEYANAVAYDSSGNIAVAGSYQGSGPKEVLLVRINPTTASFLSVQIFGGSAADEAFAIRADGGGNLYLAGKTGSFNFPVNTGLQSINAGGTSDAFIMKLAGDSSTIYSTYLGGAGADEARGIAVDEAGNVYVTGTTTSGNFPLRNPFQPAKSGVSDAFVSKLNAAGSALEYSTYLGGNLDELSYAIAVDSAGRATVAGATYSPNFPAVDPFQVNPSTTWDATLVRFNAAGTALDYATYFGAAGSGTTQFYGLAIDTAGDAYAVGWTQSAGLPFRGGAQPSSGEQIGLSLVSDGMIAKFSASGNQGAVADLILSGSSPNPPIAGGELVVEYVVTNVGPDSAQSIVLTSPLPANTTFVSASQSSGPAFNLTVPSIGSGGTVTATGVTLASGESASFLITVHLPASLADNSQLTSTASVAAATLDLNPFSNIVQVKKVVERRADLRAVATVSPASAPPGSELIYLFTLSNDGLSDAQSAALTFGVPDQTSMVSVQQLSGPAFNIAGPAPGQAGNVQATVSNFAAGASAVFRLSVRVNAGASNGTSLTSTATASAATADPQASNDKASASAQVQITQAQPSILIDDVTVLTEGNTGSSNAVFTVSMSTSSSQTVSIDYATADGTALAGSDYQAVSGTVTFTPGSTSQSISVPILGDAQVEPTENFFVNLSNPVSAGFADSQGLATILNDDTGGNLQFDPATYAVSEGAGSVAVIVTRTLGQAGDVTVRYATRGSLTAIADVDYSTMFGTLTFAANQTAAVINIPIIDDGLIELSEQFDVILFEPGGGGALGAVTTATVTILDNELPSLRINDVLVVEGDTGFKSAVFTVSLSAATGQTVMVDYATVGTSATAGIDFQAAGGTLSFAPGSTSQSITVLVLGDTVVETDESYFVNLNKPIGATVEDPQGLGTIQNDDIAGSIQLDPAAIVINEGAGVVSVRVTRTGGQASDVTVRYATRNQSAVANADYISVAGTVTFAANQSAALISVPILDDELIESAEAFDLILSDAGGGGSLGPVTTAKVTIVDNDGTPNQRFVSMAFVDLLRRPADAAGLAHWSTLLDRGASRHQVAQGIENTQEYRTSIVDGLYSLLLQRAADNEGVNHWTSFLSSVGTVEQLMASLAGSQEYFSGRGAGTNQGFLQVLYEDGLHRQIDDAGQQTWLTALAQGRSRQQVAEAIFSSDEYRGHLLDFSGQAGSPEFVQHGVVHGFYQYYLRRNADPQGLSAFLNALRFGMRDEEVIAVLVGSQEYFGLSMP